MTAGAWRGDHYTALDGREFAVFSEHVRGEPRFYEAKERVPGHGERGLGPGSRDWRPVPGAAGYDKRTVKRAVERYVRNQS